MIFTPPSSPNNEPHVDVHISEFKNGHANSIDCWCEPSEFQWTRNNNNVLLRLVAHCDFTPQHRHVIIHQRNKKPGWITELLSYVDTQGFSDA